MKRYTTGEIYWARESGESSTTEYVRATDYAALEAERDEWRRRCEESFTEWQWCLLGFIGGWSCFGLIGVLAL